uniref:Biotin sulfoxide reductase n=1 Tax=Anthurium amnicola TaxID=1678845 RepID=A0A1D1YJD2_9ARAE
MVESMRGCAPMHCALPLAFSFLLFFFFLGSNEATSVEAAIGACGGRSIEECLLERGMGMEMESEVSRLLLQQSQNERYISYRSLKGDAVPCTIPGVPYYSCRLLPGPNPHTRGCLTITRCARDTGP